MRIIRPYKLHVVRVVFFAWGRSGAGREKVEIVTVTIQVTIVNANEFYTWNAHKSRVWLQDPHPAHRILNKTPPNPHLSVQPCSPPPRPAIIPNEMECLIRKMFCIALNFIFTFARALQLVEGCHLGLLATLFYFIFSIYIFLWFIRCTERQKQCVPKRFTVHFVFCVFSPPFLLFSALHFIFSGWLTDWQTSQLNVHQLPPLYATAATLQGCKSELICLRNQAKVTRRRNCGLHSRMGGGEGVEGKGLHWFL